MLHGTRISVLENFVKTDEFIATRADKLKSEAKNSEKPFFVTDLSVLIKKHAEWTNEMPDILPHFAVKTDPNPAVIATLVKLGCGFDCASQAEIEQVLSLGVSPERIIFANTIKAPTTIRFAKSVGVSLMTFDNSEELGKISRLFPEAKLVLRITANDPTSPAEMSLKYGADPAEEAPQLLKEARNMEMRVVGVSFHVGTYGKDPFTAFTEAIKNARNVMDEGKRLGHHHMELLDIGGGFPGNDTETNFFKHYSSAINSALKKNFSGFPNLRVISEPGTFFAKSPSKLCLSVIGKKKICDNNSSSGTSNDSKPMFDYYLNDGLYGSFAERRDYGACEELKPLHKRNDKDPVYWSRLWGQTCDPQDKIEERIELPELEIGDRIICENLGCYSRGLYSPFNGFSCPKTYYIIRRKDAGLLCSSWKPGDSEFSLDKIFN